MKLLGRDKLLKKEELEIIEVDLGKGEGVYVRQMTGKERNQFELTIMRQIKDEKGQFVGIESTLDDFRAKLAVCTVCDKQGGLVFRADDFVQLSDSMSAARLTMIADAAQKLNGLSEEDKEDLIKNLDAGRAGNSSLDSAKS